MITRHNGRDFPMAVADLITALCLPKHKQDAIFDAVLEYGDARRDEGFAEACEKATGSSA